MRRYRTNYDPPWLMREIGGAPYWLLIGCAVIILGILAVVLLTQQ